MKNYLSIIFCFALAAALLQPASAGKPGPVTPEESDRVIALAFERGIGLYKKYSGVESVRKETISEYDPETSKLRSVSEVTMKRKDYFYKDPEITVLTYKKDGKEMEPSKFRVMKSMPLYPVFDARGRENYLVTVAEKIRRNGRECYRIQVEPKKQTSRHFKGSLYVAVSSMETLFIEGTIAKLDFPIREFRIALVTRKLDDVPVAESGEVHVRIRVPVFYPDTMFVSTIAALETRLIR